MQKPPYTSPSSAPLTAPLCTAQSVDTGIVNEKKNISLKKNILLKLSGEILSGPKGFGYDMDITKSICENIKELSDEGHKVSIVVGGGNICRGATTSGAGIDRAAADYMGMLGTAINAIMLQNLLENMGLQVRVLSAISMNTVCEPFILRRAHSHLQKGRIVIFASGTGTPFFSTDTAAVLRAVEMKCDLLIKGTKVDGVYDKDPMKHKDAKRFIEIKYAKLLIDNLSVMDMAAIALAEENKLPIRIFSILSSRLKDIVAGKGDFTSISA